METIPSRNISGSTFLALIQFKSDFNQRKEPHQLLIRHIEHLTNLSRAARCLAFVAFLASFVLLILLLSKLHAQIEAVKRRRTRYGFFFNARYEYMLLSCVDKLKFDFYAHWSYLIMLGKKLTTAQVKVTAESTTPIELKPIKFLCNTIVRDVGHENETFELTEPANPNKHLLEIEEQELVRFYEKKSKPPHFWQSYLQQKRANSFQYKKLRDEEIIRMNRSSDALGNVGLTKQTTKSLSFPLLNIGQRVRSMLAAKLKKPKSLIRLENLRKSAKISHLSTSMSFQLPTILITDTSKMHTSVINLDTFEPEKHRKF